MVSSAPSPPLHRPITQLPEAFGKPATHQRRRQPQMLEENPFSDLPFFYWFLTAAGFEPQFGWVEIQK
jgi:hypothetical protein